MFACGDAFRKQCGLIPDDLLENSLHESSLSFLQEILASHLDSHVTDAGTSISPSLILLILFSQSKILLLSRRATHLLAGSFGYVSPAVIRNTGHGKSLNIWLTGMIATTRIYEQITSSLLSLCTAIIVYVLPPFSCWQRHHLLPTECRPQNRISKCVLGPCFLPSQVLYPTSPLSIYSTVLPPLVDPYYHHHHRPANLSRSSHPHKWSPRAKWHSALTDIRPPTTLATLLLLLLRVAPARKAVVDGITKIRVHASSLKHRWRRRGRRRVILVEAILCLVFLNLLIKNRRFLG